MAGRAGSLGLALIVAGCTGEADPDGGPIDPVAHPLVVVTEAEGPDVALQYLHVLADWPEDLELDYTKAIELGEFPYVRAGDGAVFVYRAEDSTLERFVVDDQLVVRSDTKISFAAHGVTGWSAEIIWSSPERAFLVDEGSMQIVEFDPSSMLITEAHALQGAPAAREGLPLQLQQGVASGDRAFTAVNWRDWYTLDFVDVAALGLFDVAAPEAGLTVIEDERCASSVALSPFADEQGYVYLVGDGGLGFDLLASPNPPSGPQCVLRVAPGADTFDPGFFVDLNAATGSPGFYTAHPMPERKLLVNQWSPEIDLSEVSDPADPSWYWNYPPYFEYAIVDLETGTSEPVPDLPRAAVQFSITLRVDGLNYVQLYDQEGGADVYRVDTDATVTQVLAAEPGTDVQYLGRL
jgi:hypothetical protein